MVENEALVNLPNWLALELRIAGEDGFDPRAVELLAYRQELELRRGVLLRTIRFQDTLSRRSTLTERRFVSMADMHLSALEMALTAENWSAGFTVRSGVDGRVVDAGAQLYRPFNDRHLEALSGEVVAPDGVHLRVRTSPSHLHVVQAARTRAFLGDTLTAAPRRVVEQPGCIAQEVSVQLDQGETLVLEKLASLYASRDHPIAEYGVAARKAVGRVGRFDATCGFAIAGIRSIYGSRMTPWQCAATIAAPHRSSSP